MMLEGNQRGGAKNLALHLMKDENDHIEIHEIRGFAAQDLMGALNESYAISRGTRCKQFLYSLSLNPPPHENVTIADFEAAIEKAEAKLKLTGQPRAIVFHEKEGPNGIRRHAHAVWSRIDIEHMKAIPMPHDHLKLQTVSKELYHEHGWKMPRGFAKQSERDPRNFTLAEWQQAKRTKQHPHEIETAIKDAWAISDTKATFGHALEERGYTLAKGDSKGRIVAIDTFGEIYSVPKKVGVRVQHVRERVGDEQDLPSVNEARQKIANGMLPTLERFKDELCKKKEQDKSAYRHERGDMVEWQRRERASFHQTLLTRHQAEALKRQARFRPGVKGIWDRLRGEHKRIQRLNELEAKQAQTHDRAEKDRLIQNQLAQRRMIKTRALAMRQRFHEQRRNIRDDIAKYKDIRLEESRETDVQTLRDKFKRRRKSVDRQRPVRQPRNRGPTFER